MSIYSHTFVPIWRGYGVVLTLSSNRKGHPFNPEKNGKKDNLNFLWKVENNNTNQLEKFRVTKRKETFGFLFLFLRTERGFN
jgi:hypothetical protein